MDKCFRDFRHNIGKLFIINVFNKRRFVGAPCSQKTPRAACGKGQLKPALASSSRLKWAAFTFAIGRMETHMLPCVNCAPV